MSHLEHKGMAWTEEFNEKKYLPEFVSVSEFQGRKGPFRYRIELDISGSGGVHGSCQPWILCGDPNWFGDYQWCPTLAACMESAAEREGKM